VLVILRLVAGLVLARGAPRSAALEMRAATAAVAQTMRIARSRAIASNRPVVVALDPGAATLQVSGLAPRRMPAGIAMAVIATAVIATADAPAVIAFLPDGSSTGGRVELAGNGRRSAVGVDWLTGRVSVADVP